MKQPGTRDKSSILYIGKGIIIAVVIITASVSFVLGFYVGKYFNPQPEQQAAAPRQGVVAQPSNVIAEPTDAPVKKDDPVSQDHVSDDKKRVADKETGPKPPDPVEIQKPEPVRDSGKLREDHSRQKPAETEDTGKGTRKRRYTVQIEALKSSAAADALKEKLSKKGYKASVVSHTTKKHERLFKVFVGDFATKREAEVMSVKLKKSENLQHPFVTFRSE
ncbi:MAG TPA: SPOR domain-containing protein [Thermodesulfovibrionales bacterium]|nr:SPOR domain-containing protein [Thermodesulfovibrionales bacterium]